MTYGRALPLLNIVTYGWPEGAGLGGLLMDNPELGTSDVKTGKL